MKKLNTEHIVTVGAPLLRPGLTVSAACSENYVVEVAGRLVEMARAINKPPTKSIAEQLEDLKK